MPKLSARGQALCGIGDGIVSVDHRPIILRAGNGCWLDDDTLLANALEPDGKWHVVRCHLPEALVIPIEDGANDLVAGGGRWLAWNPARGMFGSVVRASAGVLAAGRDGTLAYCRDRQAGVDFVLNTPDGREYDVVGTIVYDMQVLGPQAAIWYDGRSIHAVGRPLPRFAVPPGRTRLVTLPDGDWLVYWSEGVGLVAQLDGALDGYVLETKPVAFNHDAVAVRGELVVCWSLTQGEGPNDLVTRIVARTAPRVPLGAPIVAEPPVAEPPNRRSASRPADGTPYDLLAYTLGAPECWPRRGPDHTLGQIVRGPLYYFVKFAGNEPALAHGESYEAWAYDNHWIYQLEDASSGDVDNSTDPRMWPRQLAIGESHAFTTGWHEHVWRDRKTCKETKRQPWHKRMWLYEVADWYWGPDLGTRETVTLVYDDTGGVHTPGRYIELMICAKGAGQVRWEAHASERVYATGVARFDDVTRAEQKSFYLVGGPNPEPRILACTPAVVPSYPPVVTPPDPPVKEPPVPAKTNDEVRRDIAELVRFYNDPDGLNRAARGIPPPIAVDDPAFWDWVALSVTTPIEQVKARIRTFPEWVENHQEEEPP